jgi:hypothetical protein
MPQRRSPFADIPADKENDVRFLLERIYYALAGDDDASIAALKGSLDEHRAKILKLEKKAEAEANCPCIKRHDGSKECALWRLEKDVLSNKWRNIGIYTGVFIVGMTAYYLLTLLISYWRCH